MRSTVIIVLLGVVVSFYACKKDRSGGVLRGSASAQLEQPKREVLNLEDMTTLHLEGSEEEEENWME